MARSTLSPGKPSEMIVRLRESALAEMNRPFVGVSDAERPSFDHEHDAENTDHRPENDLPETPLGNNPHVGNGRGPIG